MMGLLLLLLLIMKIGIAKCGALVYRNLWVDDGITIAIAIAIDIATDNEIMFAKCDAVRVLI